MDNVYDYDTIDFITLTNNGYIDYTLNCYQSLKNIKSNIRLKSYCIGEEGLSILQLNGYDCEVVECDCNFQIFGNDRFNLVTYYKFEIIHKHLLNNKYVCITDGDIVYENNKVFDYLLDNIKDNDMLIQNEWHEWSDNNISPVCSGFIFIKSNENTINIFNPKNVREYSREQGWDDQIYINSIKDIYLKYKKLPVELFPNGCYYYEHYQNIQPYLIHFNCVLGNEKKTKMIQHNKWYNISNRRVKICQYGSDGFGHQLEGTLRLLSLSINNKADYQYNFRETYTFEHNNFNIELLHNYLQDALKIISKNNNDMRTKKREYITRFGEYRTFAEILESCEDIDNTIYCYDGASSFLEILSPNFEPSYEIENALPILREAYVLRNSYLPIKSYDDTKINVCCHIRLGDAVGQRILDTDNLFNVVREFQKFNEYRIIIHTNGDINHLQENNTIIYNENTDVLQVLSDFIGADVFIMSYSSLSIAAHLLADTSQYVITPQNTGPSFKHRVLNKCVPTNKFNILSLNQSYGINPNKNLL
jgi:hypothetical protein